VENDYQIKELLIALIQWITVNLKSYASIASYVEEIYDHKISAAEISGITDKLLPIINEWCSRPLQSIYPIVFMVF